MAGCYTLAAMNGSAADQGRGYGVRWLSSLGVALVVALSMSACSTWEWATSPFTHSCVADAETVLAGVDWAEAPVVEVRIRQDQFNPMVLGLLQNRPYVLRIINGDASGHAFHAPDFFQTAAVDSVVVAGEPLADRCPRSVYVPGGATAEVRLMPTLDGRYDLVDQTFFLDLDVRVSGDGIGAIYVR